MCLSIRSACRTRRQTKTKKNEPRLGRGQAILTPADARRRQDEGRRAQHTQRLHNEPAERAALVDVEPQLPAGHGCAPASLAAANPESTQPSQPRRRNVHQPHADAPKGQKPSQPVEARQIQLPWRGQRHQDVHRGGKGGAGRGGRWRPLGGADFDTVRACSAQVHTQSLGCNRREEKTGRTKNKNQHQKGRQHDVHQRRTQHQQWRSPEVELVWKMRVVLGWATIFSFPPWWDPASGGWACERSKQVG